MASTSITVSLKRQYSDPLDPSQRFATTNDRQAFLLDATIYDGLIVYDVALSKPFIAKKSDTEPVVADEADKEQIINGPFGPLPVEDQYWVYWAEIAGAGTILLSDLFYSTPNLDPTATAVGGITQGTVIDNVDLETLLTNMFFPYKIPAITGVTPFPPFSETIKVGDEKVLGNVTFTIQNDESDIDPTQGTITLSTLDSATHLLNGVGAVSTTLQTGRDFSPVGSNTFSVTIDGATPPTDTGLGIGLSTLEFYTALSRSQTNGTNAIGIVGWEDDGASLPNYVMATTRLRLRMTVATVYDKDNVDTNTPISANSSDLAIVPPSMLMGFFPKDDFPPADVLAFEFGGGIPVDYALAAGLQAQAGKTVASYFTQTKPLSSNYYNSTTYPLNSAFGAINTNLVHRAFLIPKIYGNICTDTDIGSVNLLTSTNAFGYAMIQLQELVQIDGWDYYVLVSPTYGAAAGGTNPTLTLTRV